MKKITSFVLLIIIASCDCPVNHEGFVLDARTEKPINGATVKFDNRLFMTDSLGHFKIDYVTGFCPDCNFLIQRVDYKPQELTIDLDDDGIIYKISNSTSNRIDQNSLNFKVKDNLLYFYLTKQQ